MRMMRSRLAVIIDNDLIFAERLSRMLIELNIEPIIVNSALELISVLSIDRPSFLIVDILLNWVDPYELVRSIKSNSELKDIKIFLMSQQRENEYTESGFENVFCIYTPRKGRMMIEKLKEEIRRNESY